MSAGSILNFFKYCNSEFTFYEIVNQDAFFYNNKIGYSSSFRTDDVCGDCLSYVFNPQDDLSELFETLTYHRGSSGSQEYLMIALVSFIMAMIAWYYLNKRVRDELEMDWSRIKNQDIISDFNQDLLSGFNKETGLYLYHNGRLYLRDDYKLYINETFVDYLHRSNDSITLVASDSVSVTPVNSLLLSIMMMILIRQ